MLWQASNAQDGDFGFAYCQTALSGGATATSGVHKTLYDAGYRTAKFFGSTNSYNFIDIATDTDALGAVGTRPLVTAAGSSFTVPAQLGGNPMTLGDFTKSGNFDSNLGKIGNATISVTLAALNTRSDNEIWSFVNDAGNYGSNCSNATSNSGGITGIRGYFATNTNTTFLNNGTRTCNNIYAIFCIAK